MLQKIWVFREFIKMQNLMRYHLQLVPSTCIKSATMTQQQHFRLFSTQRPTNFDGNETDPQTHFVVPKASSNTVDPFGWEPTKWDRFYLVLTRCYARSNDIPAVIPSRIRPMFTKRMRVLRFGTALVAAIIVCFGLEFYMLGWDKHMRRGKLSKDELKFIDKMATRVTKYD